MRKSIVRTELCRIMYKALFVPCNQKQIRGSSSYSTDEILYAGLIFAEVYLLCFIRLFKNVL